MSIGDVIRLIGSMILSVILVAIPIMAGLSIVLGWYPFIIMAFCFGSACEILSLSGALYDLSKE